MSALVLDGLRKAFGESVALDGLDLHVDDGELLVLAGPLGSGRTTTLRTIAGLESPDAGVVRIDGADVTRLKARRRDVALMNPRDDLDPKRTGEALIRAAARVRGVKRSEVPQRAQEAVNLARCEAALAHRPDRLTLEGRRRVHLARALAGRPGILLLDEPLIGLDSGAQMRLIDDLRRAHDRTGRTTVHAATDATEALAMGGRIAVLREGRVAQVGTAAELYDDPASRFVAEFVGSSGLNVFPVSVRSGRLHAGPFSFALRGTDEHNVERSVEMGIRPEHIALAPTKGGTATTVVDVEITTSGAYLYLEAGEDHLLARASGWSRPKIGSTLRVAVRRPNTFLFDAETGETLPNPG